MVKQIQCGHCGGTHPSVAEIRSCSTGHRFAAAGSAPPDLEVNGPSPSDLEANGPSPSDLEVNGLGSTPLEPIGLAPDWSRLVGPAGLGRSVVVGAGQTAPEPWTRAPRVEVDSNSSPEILDRLQSAWSDREGIIIELTGALPDPEPVLRAPFWELTPDLDLVGERLRHLVFANAVDARHPAAPTIEAVSRAVRAGAEVLSSGAGDVRHQDQLGLWCDGGPLDRLPDVEGEVIPAVHLACGSLSPVGRGQPDAELAPDQLAAVRHGGGAARIIAPAGSGKTRVLVERARHLVRQVGVEPGSICLVAYNVRARDEMVERTSDLPGLVIRTLNGLSLGLITGRSPFARPAGLRSPRVIEEREVRSLLDDLVGGRRQAMADPMAAWIEALTTTRLGLRPPAEVEREFGGDVKGFVDVVSAYRQILTDRGLVDFDEQVLGAIEVLLTDTAARAAARRACSVLLVDEFQDLTPAHVLLLRLLAGPAAEVFGVGDDDQTIYGYAGASPEWLIDFARLFPGASAHDLHVNYRCPPEVVEAASNLLSHNRRRIEKTIVAGPGSGSADTESSMQPLVVTSSAYPTTDTVARVVDLLDSGVRPIDIAVLTRVNATLLGPMLALDEVGISTSARIDEAFLARTGVAGALAWLRLAVAPDGSLEGADLEIAVRRPPRGLSPRLAGWVGEQQSSRALLALARRLNEERDQKKVVGFHDDLELVRQRAAAGASTEELLVTVRDDLGLGRVLEERLDASRRSVDRSAHGDDLAALVSVARLRADPSEFGDWLSDRLGAATPDWSGVRLSTIHRVKGREWPHVIVHDASAGLFPHRLSNDIEEERRVFHVAITRASDSLLIAAGTPVSPFVRQLGEPRDPDVEPDPEPTASRRSASGPGPSTRAKVEFSGADAELVETLRSWRRVRSAADAVPAYVVFDDRTLEALVVAKPADDRQLLAVRGIGPAKISKYGPAIIALVAGEVPPASG